jgi:F-type H+-transporting ATPase subunit a
MEVLETFPEKVNELISEFLAPAMYGNEVFGLTQYIFWMCVALIIMLIVIFAAKKRMSLVPKGRFVNGFEYVVEFVRNDVILGTIGPKADKHGAFILTIFFFILFNNLVGVIPGCRPGTGTIGVTFTLALFSFVYFIVIAVKHLGALGYIKSFAPAGVAFPINILVGVIEAVSTVLRLVTLAVRLFANMFAGHICLGAFALLTSTFFMPMIVNFSVSTLVGALPTVAWFLILIVIYAIEMVVAVIQAYVFSILTAVYIQLAEADAH